MGTCPGTAQAGFSQTTAGQSSTCNLVQPVRQSGVLFCVMLHALFPVAHSLSIVSTGCPSCHQSWPVPGPGWWLSPQMSSTCSHGACKMAPVCMHVNEAAWARHKHPLRGVHHLYPDLMHSAGQLPVDSSGQQQRLLQSTNREWRQSLASNRARVGHVKVALAWALTREGYRYGVDTTQQGLRR